jgi:DNA topoisomerase-1
VDRRLDLPGPGWAHPGDRPRRPRPQAIHLPPGWREWRELTKFLHILDFAAALPRLRERVARDLSERTLSQTLVLATAVRVLDRTLMRVGNDEYARQNQSYGLTTLLDEHIESAGARVRFSFRGKHGKLFEAEFNDRRVAAVLRRLEGLPGQHLFQFVDAAGDPHRITSDDINAYIREATGGDFTAKDFRTWAATVLAVTELCQLEPATSETARKRGLAKAIRQVAARLGNTPAVCRSSYVHPANSGELPRRNAANADRAIRRARQWQWRRLARQRARRAALPAAARQGTGAAGRCRIAKPTLARSVAAQAG